MKNLENASKNILNEINSLDRKIRAGEILQSDFFNTELDNYIKMLRNNYDKLTQILDDINALIV